MECKFLLILVITVLSIQNSRAQTDSRTPLLEFSGDFRFRIEQDWNSRKSDGSFRTDRTRMRYRVRFGAKINQDWYETGIRLRTGDPRKQQDPQLTLGANNGEFNILPVGLEKAWFKARFERGGFWVGKNTFPFEKSNELFWSDNVYPEGLFGEAGIPLFSAILDTMSLKAGHFLVRASGASLSTDAFFQGIQLYTAAANGKVELFPSLYFFRNLPHIPDIGLVDQMDYTIIHIGTRIHVMKKPSVAFSFDYYLNLEDYREASFIPEILREQKSGLVAGLNVGSLGKAGNWMTSVTFAHLDRFAAVDYLAQNDWARWDYSTFDSPDGRLTNFLGMEIVVGVTVSQGVDLRMKYYLVEQLVPLGMAKETGSRIRLDLDVSF